MSLLVFLWAALTYPRPSKSFWVLLIAYTQITVAIKCVSQFDQLNFMVWWKSRNKYIKLLGIEKQNNFAVYELILLMIVFFHRAVLMTFGLWTSAAKYEFKDGTFQIEKCDFRTTKLIQKSLSYEKLADEDKELEVTVDVDGTKRSDELAIDPEEGRQKVLIKHELGTEYGEDEDKIRAVYRNPTDLIQAHENVLKDNHGQYAVELDHDMVQLKLNLIDPSSSAKAYPANQLVVVESSIEEPMDFLPSVTSLSLRHHFFIIKNLRDLLKPRRGVERKRMDVYKYMFFCEFINFLVLLFGFMEFVVSLDVQL